jgi:hypothetical protein
VHVEAARLGHRGRDAALRDGQMIDSWRIDDPMAWNERVTLQDECGLAVEADIVRHCIVSQTIRFPIRVATEVGIPQPRSTPIQSLVISVRVRSR